MSKVAISITIDSDLLNTLKEKAEESNRTLSNYIQFLLKEKIGEEECVEYNISHEEAIALSKTIKVCSYQEAEDAIENSISLSKAALELAKKI